MITRQSWALNYSGYDAAQPPPLGFTTPPANRALPTAGRMHRAGVTVIAPARPRLMADLTDPSTWQRAYRFT